MAGRSPVGPAAVPGTDDWADWAPPSHVETPDAPRKDMSITVGWNAAVQAGVTREEMDAWALRSHQRAVAAIDAGAFVDEIVPIEVTRRDGTTVRFEVDEHPRRDSTLEKLASLKPLHPEIEGFSITAGQRLGRNDGGGGDGARRPGAGDAESGSSHSPSVRAWASAGVPPGGDRAGADRRHPQGARTEPASRSATSTCGRSTRRSPRCASPPPACSASTRRSSTCWAAVAASVTRSR